MRKLEKREAYTSPKRQASRLRIVSKDKRSKKASGNKFKIQFKKQGRGGNTSKRKLKSTQNQLYL
jgi:hypothetical protein